LWLKDCAEKPQPTASVGGHFKPGHRPGQQLSNLSFDREHWNMSLQQSELFGFFSFGFQGKQQWGMGWLWLPADSARFGNRKSSDLLPHSGAAVRETALV
jgi:hypothetical protein